MIIISSLTESEIDDLTKQLCETVASQQEWQLSDTGNLYRVEGDLIFSLVLFYSDRENGLCVSLNYKMFADDDLFWRILEIEYEEKTKLNTRLNGAFRAPFLRVLDNVLEIKDWTLKNLEQQLKPIVHDMNNKVNELITKIQSEQDHLNLIGTFIEEHFQKHPQSTNVSPYYMQILSAIREGQWSIAENIIRQRLALGGGSGVGTEKGTFFALAYQYLHFAGHTSQEEVPLVVESAPRQRRSISKFEALEKSVSDMMGETIDNFSESNEAVYWIEIYLMDAKPDRHDNLVDVFGAWLGQYLVQNFDGAWSKSALGWGVSVGPGKLHYPYSQVEKYLRSGQSASLCQFVEDVRVIAEER